MNGWIKWNVIAGAIVLAFALPKLSQSSNTTQPSQPSKGTELTLREQPNQIVMHWRGPVAPPMLERFEEAFERFEGDERRIVISLDSPGGFVEHGRQIMKLIHKKSRNHQIDTLVDAGKICASMCVPIYLTGFERMAKPQAKFMFHEASITFKPDAEDALRRMGLQASMIRKGVVTKVTNELFDDDFGPRSVDAKWLAEMRRKIRGRDVWLTARQLTEQGSGVVDKLL